ncbi:purine nucleoside phosphorylase [Sphaerochaeta pleomorpha str. Grapes]|uniref:Purine nucleoside phosphorylase n=1 Tax=Sphaerochaeta pleomorpha (strain ATCC BAA-1885 / DSM 22778 / Grapes) TaxID=158190 RepID=G8QR89_SPHPG|nr:MTAP family purine nucleoside phosphorylase [Sphaerochaeta pleomorpha]AEV31024.1 purine nucleoside phosphorylase [Sphaerochaeta pleomorpha str. Grapes]
MKAIIGGTGVDTLPGLQSEKTMVATQYGDVELFVGTGKDASLVFLPRHGSEHSVPPHLINYRANIKALVSLGVDEAIGIYAVGSITDLLKPEQIGTISDFIDVTGGGRQHTFFTGGSEQVRHVSMDRVFDPALTEALLQEDPSLVRGGIYCCTNGPRLETPAEIRSYRILGADYVGMTCATEASLAVEAGLRFAALAYSINWAAGVEGSEVAFIGDAMIKQLRSKMTRLCTQVLTRR